MIKILGLSGKKRSGKNYTATIIKELVSPDIRVVEMSFAGALKKEVATFLDITIEELEGENKEMYRPILQRWGTEFRRNIYGNDYWIKQMDERIRKLARFSVLERLGKLIGRKPKDILVIITDVRFPNEADYVINSGGSMWNISNPDHKDDSNSSHASETALDDYEYFTTTLINKKGHEEQYKTSVSLRLHFYGLYNN